MNNKKVAILKIHFPDNCEMCPLHYYFHKQMMCPAVRDEYGFHTRIDNSLIRMKECPLFYEVEELLEQF